MSRKPLSINTCDRCGCPSIEFECDACVDKDVRDERFQRRALAAFFLFCFAYFGLYHGGRFIHQHAQQEVAACLACR